MTSSAFFLVLKPVDTHCDLPAQSIAFSPFDNVHLLLGGKRSSYYRRQTVPHHTADFIFDHANLEPDCAVVAYKDGAVLIANTGDANTVQINGLPLAADIKQELFDGDDVKLGHPDLYNSNFNCALQLRVTISDTLPPALRFPSPSSIPASSFVSITSTALLVSDQLLASNERLAEQLHETQLRLQHTLDALHTASSSPPRTYQRLLEDLRSASERHASALTTSVPTSVLTSAQENAPPYTASSPPKSSAHRTLTCSSSSGGQPLPPFASRLESDAIDLGDFSWKTTSSVTSPSTVPVGPPMDSLHVALTRVRDSWISSRIDAVASQSASPTADVALMRVREAWIHARRACGGNERALIGTSASDSPTHPASPHIVATTVSSSSTAPLTMMLLKSSPSSPPTPTTFSSTSTAPLHAVNVAVFGPAPPEAKSTLQPRNTTNTTVHVSSALPHVLRTLFDVLLPHVHRLSSPSSFRHQKSLPGRVRYGS
ncbi:unnamed protein product [Tilletia caries]|uniref:Uncharacterized protein n=3 Tax=Tilletia TaxID=13289 RepID=A0A177T0V2_9BASI|nr:hypothetical protein A4X03_0g8720 [Tilletia caries]CAD6958588.1 unnamed protein product [Tilletia caries]CAD7063751.1 unnamed protein product [Tilletia caries]